MIQYYFDGSNSTEMMHKNIDAAEEGCLSWLLSSKIERFNPEDCRLCLVISSRWQSIIEVNTKRDQSVLYSVMLECKIAQEVRKAFEQDVKAAPDPQCIFFDWQMQDIECFGTESEKFTIWPLTLPTTWGIFMWPLQPTLTSCQKTYRPKISLLCQAQSWFISECILPPLITLELYWEA